MKLDKDNIKKIRGLILFTIFVLVVLWNYELVFAGLGFLGSVILPFAVGGALAFLVNIPMSFFERKIFGKAKAAEKKWALKLARPVSLILTLLVIFGIIAIVMLVVIPELGRTVLNIGKTIQDFIPEVQAWAINIFRDNEEIVKRISAIDFKWDQLLQKAMDFLQNGAGSVLDSTFAAAKSIISGVSTFIIALVFSCYILAQKEKLGEQMKKVMCAFLPEDWRNILFALGSVVQKSFSSFFAGQCLEAVILGLLFLVVMVIL